MKKTKLLAVAAGFLAAAGLATAGKVYIGSQEVGSYSGNVTVTGTGDLRLPSNTTINGTGGGDTTTPSCDAATAYVVGDGCQCASGYEYNGVEGGSVPENTACTAVDTGGSTGGDTGSDTPANCSGVATAGTRDNSWQVLSGFPWATGQKEKFTVDNGKYLAIQFTAPNEPHAGYLGTAADSHALNGLHTMAMSRCPGDFNSELGTGICRKASSSHTFWWSTHGSYQSQACELIPGETYYINIKYAKGTNLTTETCESGIRCGALLFFSNYD